MKTKTLFMVFLAAFAFNTAAVCFADEDEIVIEEQFDVEEASDDAEEASDMEELNS